MLHSHLKSFIRFYFIEVYYSTNVNVPWNILLHISMASESHHLKLINEDIPKIHHVTVLFFLIKLDSYRMLAYSAMHQFLYNIYASGTLNYRFIIHSILFQFFTAHSELCLYALIQPSKDALQSPGMSVF